MFKDTLKTLRNYFVAGLFIVVPIGATVYVVWGIFNLLDQWLRESDFIKGLLKLYGLSSEFTFYGVGFLTTIFLIIFVGFLGRLYIGKKMLSLVEFILSRIPVVSWLYRLIKQISYAFLGRRRNMFERPVLIEYPRKGIYSLAFVVCRGSDAANRAVGRNLTCVFLATTPNPTSGFFLLVPNEELIPLDVSVEQAVKMVISSGLVTPDSNFELAEDEDREPDQDTETEHT
ncbi:MAG: DUF502 domain-containing protein [bacterium]